MKRTDQNTEGNPCSRPAFLLLFFVVLFFLLMTVGRARADVRATDTTNRSIKAGTMVPNPGTQAQELANITFPAPYNVFEFVVTCGACHGGTVDQNAAHFGNWAGTNMASAARDPVFRANQMIVNGQIKAATGKDGAGNMCFRCHSPNAWLSGRTDPALNGSGDGSQLIQSVLLSTDTEGISCETCHRAIGNVTMKRSNLLPTEPAWNMMSGLDDWPHTGQPYPQGPLAGMPLGDATLQFNDGMTYGGKYSGSVGLSFGDLPIFGTYYTGQTYGIYPEGWLNAMGQDVSGQVVVNPDGTTPVNFEAPIGPPLKNGGPGYDYQNQAIAIEHPTFKDDFIRSSEFCGSCHDLSIPVLNHGSPEQRTYTEWKFSAFGKFSSNGVATGMNSARCQDCHMPTMKHEYSDTARVSLNPDPTLTGYFPYGKDRNPNGGTAFHKMAGANRDLPQMMKVLYPEVDLEVVGAPTGKDTRVFPGLLSDRSAAWNRTTRNTEISMVEAASVEIVGISEVAPGSYEAQVKITNHSGHRIPSGYPDGRRLWLSFAVKNGATTVYESGYYDQATATLYNDATKSGFARALGSVVDKANNAVMVYEKKTGKANGDGTFAMSVSILNEQVVFDNRIPALGYSKNDYFAGGTKFITYTGTSELAVKPAEDPNRYPDGQNWDVVTYRFTADPGLAATFVARAGLYWQTHTRELMEFLKENDTSTQAPEGPPNIFDPNYPLTPNYLIDKVGRANMTDLNGNPLSNNWGGIAYAAWKMTGKGDPLLVAVADTAATRPVAPIGLKAANPAYTDPTTGAVIKDPFTMDVTWDRVADAEGYLVWVRYGVDTSDPALATSTASWDKLAIVRQPPAGAPSVLHEALNVAKTYQYKVQAYNGRGMGPESVVVAAQTPIDLPLTPINTAVKAPVVPGGVTLTWYDQADNEQGFVIQRQTLAPNGAKAPFADYALAPALPGFGGVTWTDTGVVQGETYNYQVAAYNPSGRSTFDLPVAAVV
ncbi:MAG TPA: multiheme c-type cytochrome, partial [Geobacteraceae bacterium]